MADLPTHIAITFCNVTGGAPTLGLYEIASGRVQVLRAPDELSIQGGATGLTLTDRHVFVMTSRTAQARAMRESAGPSTLFVFDRVTLTPLARHECASVYDAHSIVATPDGLLVVSTGTDTLMRLRMDGPSVTQEEVVWRPDIQGAVSDVHHLNGLSEWRGQHFVSALGRKASTLWSSAGNGFIQNVTTGDRVADGIRHPHSPRFVDDSLWYCESADTSIAVLGSDRRLWLSGYARGICDAGEFVFVATSRGRQSSWSPELLTNRADPGPSAGRCSLHRLRKDDLGIEAVTNLDPFGSEVYELTPVSSVEQWPIVPDNEWRDRLISGLKDGCEDRDAAVCWLHTEVAARDDQIAWLHGEVADRDRTVRWLHGEVASRDRQIETLQAGETT